MRRAFPRGGPCSCACSVLAGAGMAPSSGLWSFSCRASGVGPSRRSAPCPGGVRGRGQCRGCRSVAQALGFLDVPWRALGARRTRGCTWIEHCPPKAKMARSNHVGFRRIPSSGWPRSWRLFRSTRPRWLDPSRRHGPVSLPLCQRQFEFAGYEKAARAYRVYKAPQVVHPAWVRYAGGFPLRQEMCHAWPACLPARDDR